MNNNILEFIVKMKDLMSSQLTKLATTGKNTFAKIDSNIKQTMANVKFMGNSVNELRNRLVEVNEVRFGTVLKSEFKQATTEAKKLETQISRLEGRQRGGSGRGMLSGIGSYLGPLVVAGALMSFGKSSINSAMQFDAQKTSFGVLTGNRGTGVDLANNLRQLKQDTIMGPTVYKNAQTMLGFGIAANKVIPDLKMLGDVSMGDADKLKRLTLAFSEVEAAGKLNGRRMLQFVNAGFNPLLEMSRTTGKSMEQLAEMMKKGGISASMLEESFKSATSAGGRFNNMLNTMAETPLGKMKRFEGQWAAFKIDVGEFLMPIATSFMDSASSALSFLNIHKSIPAVLSNEQSSINALVKSITGLNGENDVRINLLQRLKNSYPDLFGKIDIEKTTNLELLQILDKVNLSYEKRISLAQNSLQQNSLDKELQYTVGIAGRAQQQLDFMKSGHTGFFDTGMFSPYMEGFDNVKIRDAGFDEKSISGLQGFIDYALKDVQRIQSDKNGLSKQNEFRDNYSTLQQALDVAKDSKIDKLFKTKEGKDIFLAEIPHVAALKSIIDDHDFMNFGNLAKVAGYDFDKLRKLLPSSVTAAGIVPKTTDESTKASGKEVASSMTSGGPRVININGVKFTDKIEIHSGNITEGMNELERKFEDMFLRILNSGASVS